jgi:hypothetical protein
VVDRAIGIGIHRRFGPGFIGAQTLSSSSHHVTIYITTECTSMAVQKSLAHLITIFFVYVSACTQFVTYPFAQRGHQGLFTWGLLGVDMVGLWALAGVIWIITTYMAYPYRPLMSPRYSPAF